MAMLKPVMASPAMTPISPLMAESGTVETPVSERTTLLPAERSSAFT
jgi:hypothetical protein